MSDSVVLSHPYGVLPSGNAYFADKALVQVRALGLGALRAIISDEALIEILGYLNASELCSTLSSSRILYAFAMHNDLWRDLSLRLKSKKIRFACSWRDTYVGLVRGSRNGSVDGNIVSIVQPPLHEPLRIRGAFSNALHRPWACRSCDLSSFSGFFQHDDITRKSAKDLTPEQFRNEYEIPNIPLIICDGIRWPAMEKWTEEYLSQTAGSCKFRATSATAPVAANFTLKDYFAYSKETIDEVPMYLFERDFANAVPQLNGDYEVPKYFSADEYMGTDLFRLFGQKRRPDHKWLIAGPARSGSIFHIDPNNTNAWNVTIRGRKKWIFYPPGVCPPGVVQSPDGADVTVPLSTGEWLLAFWGEHLKARNAQDANLRPIETIAQPGEIVFVPHGWWHMVLNIDDCIALTHNYVSTSNLSDVLRFLRETPDQISGVRDRAEEAVQADDMYAEFLTALKAELPAQDVENFITKSMQSHPAHLEELRRTRPNSIVLRKKRLRGSASAGGLTHKRRHIRGGMGRGLSEVDHNEDGNLQAARQDVELDETSGDSGSEDGLLSKADKSANTGAEFTFSFAF
jgi:hypothetical protein